MASRNDITGDSLVSKTATEAYRAGWDRIFGNKGAKKEVTQEVTQEVEKKDLEQTDEKDR